VTVALLSWSAARDEAHRQGVRAATRPLGLLLTGALGRTLAADLHAPGDVPGHDGAAMDGWAVAGDGP
jgi:molybdopterin molybdotransferase